MYIPTFVEVAWIKPQWGWFKLNMNRSSIGSTGKAGARVIIRNHNRDWVIGSFRHIPSSLKLEVEKPSIYNTSHGEKMN